MSIIKIDNLSVWHCLSWADSNTWIFKSQHFFKKTLQRIRLTIFGGRMNLMTPMNKELLLCYSLSYMIHTLIVLLGNLSDFFLPFLLLQRGMNVWHVLDLVCQKLKMLLWTQKITRHHHPYWKWTSHRPYWKWTLVLQLPKYLQLLLHLMMMTVILTCLVMTTTMMSNIVRLPIL